MNHIDYYLGYFGRMNRFDFWIFEGYNLESRGFSATYALCLCKFLKREEVNILPRVDLRSGESQAQLYSRFRKAVTRSGVLTTLREKKHFVSRVEARRIEKKKAIRRAQRKNFIKGKA